MAVLSDSFPPKKKGKCEGMVKSKVLWLFFTFVAGFMFQVFLREVIVSEQLIKTQRARVREMMVMSKIASKIKRVESVPG